MTLRTVRVPPEMAEVFATAESVVERYFAQRVNDPERGTIEISGERYILVRAASLSVEFFALVHKLYGEGREHDADEFARNILFDLAHAVGKSDARNFHAKMGLRDPIACLSAGPVHFAHSGWAFVEIHPESNPAPDESYFMVYDHPYSFEASAWLHADRRSGFTACVMNSGYSSGWCAESFGLDLVSTEIMCRARGDSACRFVMAHPSRIETMVERYRAKTPGLGAPADAQIPDLFARKRIEEELRRSRDELEVRVRQRTRELEEANALLKEEMAQRASAERRLAQAQKLEAVGRLAGGVAHDFNNLLGVILGRSTMVQSRTPRSDPLWDDVEAIRIACVQGASLTRHMIAFSRGQPADAKPIDLGDLVRSFAGSIAPLVGEEIAVVIEPSPDGSSVLADRAQLEQVLINLVVNARDAMPEGGTLSLRTARTAVSEELSLTTATLPAGEYVVLTISDTGAGMDQETQAQVFDPFFSTKPSGTGLGLSIVYGIVQGAGGGIAVRSSPREGTSFSLYFPSSELVPAPRQPSARGIAPQRRGNARVMLVEDQKALRDTLEEGLIGAGYEVIAVSDPTMALALVEKGDLELDVLVTDIRMPKLGGRELAVQIGALRPEMRVLYISGYEGDSESSADRAATLSSMLRKPFSIDELARAIEELLRGDLAD